ncbi:MAG: NAD(P)/FAD-dependent oxidoreductase [Spirochaetota bacterium]
MYDVIVVGAGPAGATAARHCASCGLKTILIEKERLPRDKPCAGGLTLAAVKQLGFPLPDEVIERKCRGFRITYGNRTNIVAFNYTVTYTINRKTFDSFLVDKALEAGVELGDGVECLRVEILKDRVMVKTKEGEIQGGIVIGADGVYSKVLRSFKGYFGKNEKHFCITAEILLPEEEISERMDDLIDIHFSSAPPGYAWLFPKKNHISAGMGCGFSRSKELVSKFKEFLAVHNLRCDIPLKGYFIPVFNSSRRVIAERVILCGDAAGFVDSFSGEGIRFAIISGRLAAQTAASAFKKGDFSIRSIEEYEEECHTAFRKDLECAERMSNRFIKSPRIVLKTAIGSKKALYNYLRTITGEIPLWKFLKWLKKRAIFFIIKKLLSCYPRK